MHRRTLGRTGLSVSEIGFGAVEIGMEYGIQVAGQPNQPSRQQAIEIVRTALDKGVNVVDTARGYGASESIIGEAIEDIRDDVVLMSKVSGIDESKTPDELTEFLRDSLETSLRELRTDVIDVYQIHSATMNMLAQGHVVECLRRFREEGKVRFLGATVYESDQAIAVIEEGQIDVLQIAFSMLAPGMSQAIIPKAVENGVAIVARSVLHRGVLTPKGAAGSAEEQRLHQAAKEYTFLFDAETQSLSHAALRFVLSNSDVSCALLGMDNMEQVQQNLGYGDIRPFSAEQIEQVLANPPDDPWSILPVATKGLASKS